MADNDAISTGENIDIDDLEEEEQTQEAKSDPPTDKVSTPTNSIQPAEANSIQNPPQNGQCANTIQNPPQNSQSANNDTTKRQKRPLNRLERTYGHFQKEFTALERWLYSREYRFMDQVMLEKKAIHMVKSCLVYLHTNRLNEFVNDATIRILAENEGKRKLLDAVYKSMRMYWDDNCTLEQSLDPFDVYTPPQSPQPDSHSTEEMHPRATAPQAASYAAMAQQPGCQAAQTHASPVPATIQVNPTPQTIQPQFQALTVAPANMPTATLLPQATYSSSHTATPEPVQQGYYASYATTTAIPNYVVEQHANFTWTANRTLFIGASVAQETVDYVLYILRQARH